MPPLDMTPDQLVFYRWLCRLYFICRWITVTASACIAWLTWLRALPTKDCGCASELRHLRRRYVARHLRQFRTGCLKTALENGIQVRVMMSIIEDDRLGRL